ncbi:hydantoinase/oxoprolinase N-terminal domain-containing protein [Photobacterium rosenbergii]|uniref:hydantoinase/oxoprolinase N-terminal domain-containing protein n=1 Tax=Photobacterium rosenbergii TaxID=294936 RepID=UPI001C98EDFB|nr:hydantoinase/oxoprolinase family protein [Photobacterium rosenbergii]MBY5946762.1 hydantoinase/oxoprolinase family protein [Photobacterium rosenbergii]
MEEKQSRLGQFRLGIDVGGTNTDGVLLDAALNCVAKVKVATSADIASGIDGAISALLQQANITGDQVQHAMLGTTQCTNAIVERKGLDRVGMIRLSLPSGSSVPPLCGWSREWQDLLGGHFYEAHGGYEYDGQLIAEIQQAEIRQLCQQMRGKVDSVAICGVFSPVNNQQELQVAQWLREELPGVGISLSHKIGSLGMLERENATILNAALQGTAKRFVEGFCHALETHRINVTPYFGQNDGTLMSQEFALKYPILTVACGPTNSIRGASHLTKLADAIVVDVGGTTSDIGALTHGYPRESSAAVELGEVRTNFRMPDILAIGIGGGTVVKGVEGGVDGSIQASDARSLELGPESVGHQLTQKARSFGGDTLTLTDIALEMGAMTWTGEPQAQPLGIDMITADQVYQQMVERVEEGIDKMKTSAAKVPVILVGGGSALLPDSFSGVSEVVRPEHFEVANAIGVALGEISGQLDKIVEVTPDQRQIILKALEQEAEQMAVEAGACPDSVQVIERHEIPLSYLQGNRVHVKIKAAGKIA